MSGLLGRLRRSLPDTWRRALGEVPQVSDCITCGTSLAEWRRQPCPVCGSLNRIVRVEAIDLVHPADRAT